MGFSLNPLHDLSSAFHAGERFAGEVLHTGEKVAEDGAKGFASAMKDAAKAVTHMPPSDIGHTALNVAGMIPVIGAPADAINAGWYAAQGDWKDAALSAATAVPGVGDLVGGARLGATALKIAEGGVKAERVIKDGTEAASTAKNAEKVLRAAKAAGGAGAEGAAPLRPSWRASELDVGARIESQGYRAQISFKDGVEVPYGTKGSVRPEYYNRESSIEVKNYSLETERGRANLVRNVSGQALERAKNLPPGTTQNVYIDVRGQSVSRADLNAMINRIVQGSNGAIQPNNINILR